MHLSHIARKGITSALTSLAVAAVGLLLAAGCGAQSGKTIFTQGPTGDAVMGEAPETGTYKLFTALGANPTKTVKLNEGDPLGFRKTADGRIEAVAGDETTVLGKLTSQAYWKLQKD